MQAEIAWGLIATGAVIVLWSMAVLIPGIKGNDSMEGGLILAAILVLVGIWMLVFA